MKNIPDNYQVTIAINEAFTSVSAIERLRTLPRDARNCAIFFNFTVFPPTVSVQIIVASTIVYNYVCTYRMALIRERKNTTNN